MKYAVEPLTDSLIEELRPFWNEQYEELSNVKGVIRLDPDIDQLKMLHDSNTLFIVTVRKENELIGYLFWLIFNHLHFTGVLHAIADLYHITKSERGNGAGKAMFEYAINFCSEKGVKRVLLGEKTEHAHSMLIESFGFKRTEQFYQLVLDND